MSKGKKKKSKLIHAVLMIRCGNCGKKTVLGVTDDDAVNEMTEAFEEEKNDGEKKERPRKGYRHAPNDQGGFYHN